MKTKILKTRLSFEVMKIILSTLGFLMMSGFGNTSTLAQNIPYNHNEVQKIKAFLECPSMISGKTNADLLGYNINDPGTWATWIDYIPGTHPKVMLQTKHVLNMGWERASLAGSLDISGFKYMQMFLLDCSGGTASTRSNFTSINVSDNDSIKGFYMRYVSAGAVNISNNPSLGNVQIRISDVHTLTINQPNLTGLVSSTLGDVPLSLSQYPSLNLLELNEIDNIPVLDLSGLPELATLTLNYMGGLHTIQMGNKLNLTFVNVFTNPHLKVLDLTTAPNIYSIDCSRNGSLASIDIGSGRPKLDRIYVNGNPLLQSLELTNMPVLEYLKCEGNAILKKLVFSQNPKLKNISCSGNALSSLDVSGLPALISLRASDNQLTEFNGSGVTFRVLTLDGNKLHEISAKLIGHTIHLKAYENGGYVGFSAASELYSEDVGILINYKGLPAPYNTSFEEIKGTGLPSGNAWKSSFTLKSDIDATFYFYADVHLLNYFEKAEDNPAYQYGQRHNLDVNFIVGDSIVFPEGFPAPSKTGYELYGWYSDSTLTNEWVFGKDILRGELTLYPNWLPKGMPVVLSVKRQMPTNENTSADHVTYNVTFSKTVSGIDISDFKLTSEGTVTGKIASVSAANGNTISVEVNTITGTGKLRLDVKNTGTGIVDANSNPLAGGFTGGETYIFGTATAIEDDFQAENSCKIFPNPTNGKIEFQTSGNNPVNRIEIFNIQGKPVLSINYPLDNQLDLTSFPDGIYLVRIQTESGIHNQKIVKSGLY
jgi:hypothetical protein